MEVRNDMTQAVLEHIREEYGVEPEFLWAKTPENAALRHPKTKKWFGALLLKLPRERLGLPAGERVDVLNLKCDPRLSGSIVDGRRIFPGYHMNKEHWISLLLDGSVKLEESIPLIALSYLLTAQKRTNGKCERNES